MKFFARSASDVSELTTRAILVPIATNGDSLEMTLHHQGDGMSYEIAIVGLFSPHPGQSPSDRKPTDRFQPSVTLPLLISECNLLDEQRVIIPLVRHDAEAAQHLRDRHYTRPPYRFFSSDHKGYTPTMGPREYGLKYGFNKEFSLAYRVRTNTAKSAVVVVMDVGFLVVDTRKRPLPQFEREDPDVAFDKGILHGEISQILDYQEVKKAGYPDSGRSVQERNAKTSWYSRRIEMLTAYTKKSPRGAGSWNDSQLPEAYEGVAEDERQKKI